MSELINNVSDTARWVAVYRANESARPDAIFSDPLAARLAGERGRAMAAVAPRMTRNGWPMIARTKLIDDLIAKSLAEGCDRVINLAAGLDTRPYRLALPSTLHWIEADLPAMIDEKEKLLANETPRCKLTRERVDLADDGARAAFLARASAGAQRALVISEGLLIYLDDGQVRALGRALATAPIRWWTFDLAAPAVRDMMMRRVGAHLDNSPMKFAPSDGVAFFEAIAGWKVRNVEDIFLAAKQYRRLPTLMRLMSFAYRAPEPRQLGRTMWSAVVRLERD